MARVPSVKARTVSICVTRDEQQLIRDASIGANMTVSGWAANRAVLALASPQIRNSVAEAASRIAETAMPKGAREQRISMVMREPDYEHLQVVAETKQMAAHAFAQAALIEAAGRELDEMPPGQVLVAHKVKRSGGLTLLAHVPPKIADLDVQALSQVVVLLLEGIIDAVHADKAGPVIRGVEAQAQRAAKEGGMVTMKLLVPEILVRAVAIVLRVDHNHLLTALTMKAAKQVKHDPPKAR